MTARLQSKPRGTEFAPRAYMRGDHGFVPVQPMGVNRDHPASELGPEVWSSCRGVLFRNDAGERQGGDTTVDSPTLFGPQYLLPNQGVGAFYWLYPSANGIGVWDGQNDFDISPDPPAVVGANAIDWTGANLNNVAVLNAADQVPWFWDGQVGNIMQALPGWIAGSTALSLRAFKTYLIAMNITQAGFNGGTTVRWSDSADPGSIPTEWAPTPDNEAGDAQLSATPGNIVDGAPLRDTFVIYKQHATYLMQFVGGQFVFLFRKQLVTSGMLSRNCVAEFLGRHVVLTDGDVILFDGQNAHSLLQDRMKRWLFSQISGATFESCYVQAYATQSEVWICFPETGETVPNIALVWDTNTDSWGVRDLYPATTYVGRGIVPDTAAIIDWDGDSQAWDLDSTAWNQSAFNPTHDGLIAADEAGLQLIHLDEGDLRFDGTPVEGFIGKESMIIDKAGNEKLITAVWPKIEAGSPVVLQVRVGVQQTYGQPIQWGTVQEYDPQVDTKVDVLAVGRLISVQFGSTSSARWRLKGFAVEVAEAGMN